MTRQELENEQGIAKRMTGRRERYVQASQKDQVPSHEIWYAEMGAPFGPAWRALEHWYTFECRTTCN